MYVAPRKILQRALRSIGPALIILEQKWFETLLSMYLKA
jgi:hypothetical protein